MGEEVCGKGFEEYILMLFGGGGGRKKGRKREKIENRIVILEKSILIKFN
jgi:hypothetical protein